MADPTLTERQRKIHQYLAEFRIEEILGDLLNTLAHNLDPNPIVFMIKYLSNLCPPQVLKDNGITIEGPLPSPNLAVVFPRFIKPSRNLFKAYLKPEIFLDIKNNKTEKNMSLREIIAVSLENEDHPIGVFAPDKDAYRVFEGLFDPILKEIHKIDELKENSYSTTSDDILPLVREESSLSENENQMLDQMTIKFKRNLAQFTFNPYMDNFERKGVLDAIADALQQLGEEIQGIYTINEVPEKIVSLLKDNMGIAKFSKTRPANARFKDWPANRMVVVQKDSKYCLFINKDEHLEVVFHKKKDIDFSQDVNSALEVLAKLQSKLDFAFSDKYGYVMNNLKYTGVGMRIKIQIKIPEDRVHIFKLNLSNLKKDYPYISIRELNKKQGLWMIRNTKTLGFTEVELIKAFRKTLNFLLMGVVELDMKLIEEEMSILEHSRDGYLEKIVLSNSELDNTSNLNDLTMRFLRAKSEGTGEYGFTDLINCGVIYPNLVKDSFDVLKHSFLVVRRNVDGFAFKGKMKEEDNTSIIKSLNEFAKSLPLVMQGEIIMMNNEKYEKIAQDIIDEYGLIVNPKNQSAKSDKIWPLGTAIFRSFNSKLVVFANLEDHFTVIYEFSSAVLQDTFKEILIILNLLEKKSLSFAYHKEFGYITTNSENTGSAIELSYISKLPKNIPKLPEGVQAQSGNNSLLLRATRANSKKMVALINFVSSVIQTEKRILYETTYSTQLKEFYPPYVLDKIAEICKGTSYEVLDTFNSILEFQCYDSSFYIDLEEPYLEHINTTCPRKRHEANLKVLPDIEVTELPSTCPELVAVKVEMGRNVEKYHFRQLMTTEEKEELGVAIQNAFKSLKIEGQLFDYKEIYNISSSLKSIFNSSFAVKGDDKVFIPIDRRFAIWVNQLDHLRVVGQVPINEVKAILKDFEALFVELEKKGTKLLYNEKYGYISEKLEFCGMNLHFSMQVITSKQRRKTIEDAFKSNKRWNINANDTHNDTQSTIILTSTGLFTIEDILVDINKLVEAVKKANEEHQDEDSLSFSPFKPLETPRRETSNNIFSKYFSKNFGSGSKEDEAKRTKSPSSFLTPQRSELNAPRLVVNGEDANNDKGNFRKKTGMNLRLIDISEADDPLNRTTGANNKQPVSCKVTGTNPQFSFSEKSAGANANTLVTGSPQITITSPQNTTVHPIFGQQQAKQTTVYAKTTTNQAAKTCENPSGKMFDFSDAAMGQGLQSKKFELPTDIDKSNEVGDIGKSSPNKADKK